MRVYSPYQDYYEVVHPNAHEATYIRSYYGPPYAGKYPAQSAPCPHPLPHSSAKPRSCGDHGFSQAGPSTGPSPTGNLKYLVDQRPPHSIDLTFPLKAGPLSRAVPQYPFLSSSRPLVAKHGNDRLPPKGLAVGKAHPLVCQGGSSRSRSFLAVAP